MESITSYLLQAPLAGPQMGAFERGGHGGGLFGFFAGGLVTAVWAAIIVLTVMWVVRNWSSPKNPVKNFLDRAGTPAVGNTQTPLEVVQLRYAKGEITREEYEALRRDLAGEAPATQAPS